MASVAATPTCPSGTAMWTDRAASKAARAERGRRFPLPSLLSSLPLPLPCMPVAAVASRRAVVKAASAAAAVSEVVGEWCPAPVSKSVQFAAAATTADAAAATPNPPLFPAAKQSTGGGGSTPPGGSASGGGVVGSEGVPEEVTGEPISAAPHSAAMALARERGPAEPLLVLSLLPQLVFLLLPLFLLSPSPTVTSIEGKRCRCAIADPTE